MIITNVKTKLIFKYISILKLQFLNLIRNVLLFILYKKNNIELNGTYFHS